MLVDPSKRAGGVITFPNEFTHSHLQKQGGGDGGGDMIETRVAVLESDVKHIQSDVTEIKGDLKDLRKEMHTGFSDIRKEMKTDFRWLLAMIVGVAGMLAKGFGWL